MTASKGFIFEISSRPAFDSLLDLLIGRVLAQCINCPNRRGNPTNKRQLQDEADHSGDRTPDRKESQPGKKQRNE